LVTTNNAAPQLSNTVIVSAKTEYACVAMLELAVRHGTGEPVRIRDIADQHAIPSRFLVQILLQLKTAGLVSSVRGASGGYQLAKEPDDITLGDVMMVVDSQWGRVSGGTLGDSATSRTLYSLWQQVAAKEQEVLSSVTFADLAQRLQTQDKGMYYI
jgi:Rrf2 family protein